MFVFWRIRCINRQTREFFDRDLSVDTRNLAPIDKAHLEFLVETRDMSNERGLLAVRHLLCEDMSNDTLSERIEGAGEFRSFSLHDYFEDEFGVEVSSRQLGAILTRNPCVVSYPAGLPKHHIELLDSPATPLPVVGVALTDREVTQLAYFCRDLDELSASTLMREGPGTLTISDTPSDHKLKTAYTGEELQSFVIVFRRLYMENEPANFTKTAQTFVRAVHGHQYAKWVHAEIVAYRSALKAIPKFLNGYQCNGSPFTTKKLVDACLNTQYAHQPKPIREVEFAECLDCLHGSTDMLTWVLADELYRASIGIQNVGRVITKWFHRYCEYHGVVPKTVTSPRESHRGLGAGEKRQEQVDRIRAAKAGELARSLWEGEGRPDGGPSAFLPRAIVLLRATAP